MLKYNLCFILQGERVLMLNRVKPPLMGLWQGVGGKLERDETPYASVLREVREETGITLKEARFTGVVTWKVDERDFGGMYVYVAELPLEEEAFAASPVETEEGLLAWKTVEWVTRPDNQGVPAHVRQFLSPMLTSGECRDYRCVFHEGKLLSCESLPLDIAYADATAEATAGSSLPIQK